jgi:1-acyl-sn-glycerol-3-phosphate acyltransferase
VPHIAPDLRAAARATGFAALTVVQLGAVQAHERISPPAERAEVFDRHMRVWVCTLLKLFGVRILRAPRDPPPRGAVARLVVSNHRSPIDVAVLLALFGGHVLSRADLSDWPILGTAARKAGTIFVDRDHSGSGAKAIREIRRRLKDGASVIVFPEGTTFAGDQVRPFRAGAFVGAQTLDLEIVPVGIAYEPGAEFVDESFPRHLHRMASRRCTRVAVRVGPAIRPRGTAADVAQQTRDVVQHLVHEAREMLERSQTRTSRS